MSDRSKPLDINEWIGDFTQVLSTETNKLIEGEGRKFKGFNLSPQLKVEFICRFLRTTVYGALTEDSEGTKKEKFEDAKKRYLEMKLAVQEAVSVAFQDALGSYSGKTVEYYCQIKPVPDAKSKEVC